MQDTARPANPYAGYPGYGGGGAYPGPGYGRGPAGYPQGYGGAYPTPYAGAGGGGMAAGPGSFNVLSVTEPVRVWAHDDTVQGGKTYRYAIYYYLRNPVFQMFNVAPQELINQYAIKSELSRWSAPVKITPKVNFFLAGVGKDNAKFEVFTRQKGAWRKKTINRAPGDLIPDTTWTVVDARKEGNENYVLLVNQGGQIQRRNFSEDRKSTLYQNLNDQAEAATKGATAAADR
jgi:hypothetical protein